MNQKSRDIALSGLLVSIMLLLGWVETLIPLQSAVPGVKIGLSNSVLLYSLYMLGKRRTFLLMILKVLLSGLLFGGISAMMYGFAGGLLSVLVMVAIMCVPGVGIVGASVAGAVAHSVGQVLVAMLILKTDKLLYYLGFLSMASIVAGILTGVVSGAVLKRLSRQSY